MIKLTETELKIQEYINSGKNITEIADILNISCHTVRSYIDAIAKKAKNI